MVAELIHVELCVFLQPWPCISFLNITSERLSVQRPEPMGVFLIYTTTVLNIPVHFALCMLL